MRLSAAYSVIATFLVDIRGSPIPYLKTSAEFDFLTTTAMTAPSNLNTHNNRTLITLVKRNFLLHIVFDSDDSKIAGTCTGGRQ